MTKGLLEKELLEKDSSVSIQDRNLRGLATEMYKIFNGILKSIMNEIFTLRCQTQYNPRNWSDFCLPKI